MYWVKKNVVVELTLPICFYVFKMWLLGKFNLDTWFPLYFDCTAWFQRVSEMGQSVHVSSWGRFAADSGSGTGLWRSEHTREELGNTGMRKMGQVTGAEGETACL